MSLIEINKTNLQVQMSITGNEIKSLEHIIDVLGEVACELLSGWVKQQQEQRLSSLIGEPWKPLAEEQIGLACPQCSSVHLHRKCWRERTLSVACFGKVSVPRRQVACQDCGNTWMPFESAMKLPSGSHGAKRLAQAIGRLMEMSYQKAGDADSQGPSAGTLHRLVQRTPSPKGIQQAQTVVIDATDVPAWRSSGQISLSMAHEIAPSTGKVQSTHRPPRRKRRLVGVAAGGEADIKPSLETTVIQGVVHDGKLNLKTFADHQGRCRWHIPYTVGYLLYRDGIKGDANKARRQALRQAIHINRSAIKGWLQHNRDAPTACTHVRESLPALQQMDEHPEAFTVGTTSHLEREMVEINKRFQNGGGWTPSGAEHLLGLHQLHRFEPEKYHQTVQKITEQTVSSN